LENKVGDGFEEITSEELQTLFNETAWNNLIIINKYIQRPFNHY
jgi:hypothetical protein